MVQYLMDVNLSEIIRKRYTYRRLILQGKILLPYKAASCLIGPDCAYHLYSLIDTTLPYDKNDKITEIKETY
ncbi:MAG: hypothetical protein JXD21_01315 [Candidatus Omnitrophica bacterium]|nr:hypothetical protein [Candidatus Omnitrophota bacterium]